jgi:hypothetical protein
MRPLIPTSTPEASINHVGQGAWTLEIPPACEGKYQLAQLDDYSKLKRHSFPWKPPLKFSLRARASATDLPGTWGFGFWNDPFSLSLGLGGGTRKLPTLPNAAWFFHASPENYLSLRDDLPAQGLLAATFRSPLWPPILLAPGVPLLPFLIWKFTNQFLRRIARQIIRQDAAQLIHDPTQWTHYSLDWQPDRVIFAVNKAPVFETPIAPKAPLGLVLWIDNQYAALPPEGSLAFGSLNTQRAAQLEIDQLQIRST